MVNFPGLGLQFDINPIAFDLFGIQVYWYGVIISFSIILSLILIYFNCEKYKISKNKIESLFIYLIPISILGARAFYVLFNLDYYLANPIKILNIREGGLAIYGGIIAGLIFSYFWCKVNKINFLALTDLILPYLALSQAIGRWGNFFNQEAYGVITNLPWGMQIWSKYYNDFVMVHPTFLYESLWNVLLFIILIKIRNNINNKLGIVTLIYLGGYGLGRFWIEGLRVDSLMIGSFRISQIFSIFLVIICIFVGAFLRKNNKNQK